MPKATMHENHGASRREHKIGSAGKIAAMQPIAITERMNKASNNQFRFGMLGANERHALASL
jgi:formiminotetrahydrofolate cyclodeaminase